MSDLGGLDIGMPDEAQGSVSEGISEDAKQRFAAAAAAMQQIRREEKKSKKRDTQVAKAIARFLSDDRYAHLFVLISRLVARDCPSTFILAILSLIDEGCLNEVMEYLKEVQKDNSTIVDESTALTTTGQLNAEMNGQMVAWITRMQLVLSIEPAKILMRLMVDERNLDGTVLQLTTFVVKEFFEQHGRSAPYEKIQSLTGSILQSVFEPFIPAVRKAFLDQAKETKDIDD